MPSADWKRISGLEVQLVDTVKRLAKSRRQLNQLTDDVGLYKSKWAQLAIGDFNPEEISFEEYFKMSNYDAQVIAGLELIEMGVLMKPWRIIHEDEEIVDILTKSLNKMKHPSIREAMKEMMDAFIYGFSVTEIVFQDTRGWWVPRISNGLKTFDPNTIKFFSDAYGNLLKVEQRMGADRAFLPLGRTPIWTHEREWGNWYGKSLLRGCYKNWFIKDAMLKFANIAYERFGSPILLGVAKTERDMAVIAEAIEHVYARSQAVIRKVDKEDPTAIQVLESKRTEMPFDRYIRYQNEMILRRMLIGQNVFEGAGSTYGPKVPLDLVFMRFEDFRLELTTQMNELLQTITDLNWTVDKYPLFQFAPLTTMDQAQITQKIFDAIDREIIGREETFVRDQLGFPRKVETERKEIKAARYMPGRYFVDPHARWLAAGYKRMIVAAKPYKFYNKKRIYIVSENGVHGIMVEGEPDGPHNAEIQKKWAGKHRITEREWGDWWPNEDEFWVWRPKVVERFDPPLKYEPPRGVRSYIKRVGPQQSYIRKVVPHMGEDA